MSAENKPLLHRLLKIGAVAAAGVAALVWPATWVLAGQAETLQLIAPFDAATIEVNRFIYEDEQTGSDEDVIAIYGTRFGEPEEILFADESAVIHPVEKPGLALLKKGAEENPLKLEMVQFLARATSLGAAVAAIGMALLLVVLRRRAGKKVAAEPVAD